MNIAVNNINVNYNNYNISNNKSYQYGRISASYMMPNDEITFKSRNYVKKTESILQKINPINLYMNVLFNRSVIASKKRFVQPKPEIEDICKEIKLKNNNFAWDINKNNSKKYIMVLHGLSQNITNQQYLYSNIVNRSDYAVFAPEYRGFGKNKKCILTLDTLLEDSQNALDYLTKEKKINPKNIYVIGHSFGGLIASQLVERNENVGKLILVSTIDYLNSDTVNMKRVAKNKKLPFINSILQHFNFIKKKMAKNLNVQKHLQNINVPICIIHSKNDSAIHFKSAKNLAKICKNLEALRLTETGGHGVEMRKVNEIIKIINPPMKWLNLP